MSPRRRPALVLFYGAGSGMGKSTLCRAAEGALSATGRCVRRLDETYVFETAAFESYIGAVRSGRGDDAALLLSACDAFLRECGEAEEELWLADSLLPCVDWLVTAGCSADRVRAFLQELCARLAPFAPPLVLVVGDVGRALDRAVAERGGAWARDLAARRTPGGEPPELVTYFEGLQSASRELLADWPFPKLVVDTTARDPASCAAEIVSWLAQSAS